MMPVLHEGYFSAGLESDPELAEAIGGELRRQRDGIELIASENIVSRLVLEAQGSVLTNKTVEGLPHRRYYGGAEFAAGNEALAVRRARELFGCGFANVQPHSGSNANAGVFLGLLKLGDIILSMNIAAGGHISHGHPATLTGRDYKIAAYGVNRRSEWIDLDEVRDLALRHQPRMIIAGGSAYPRAIDFAAFRAIADEVGAYLLVDMAHFAGLVAAGLFPSPLSHAHVVTTTTHKTLRGPRGGLILTNDEDLAKKINSAIFPGIQGGPLMHVIAAKAVAFGEALQPEFKIYAHATVANAKILAATVAAGGYAIVSGGTDNHLMLVDLPPKGLTGKAAEASLGRAHITCNKNGIPFDPQKPAITSGVRLGSPAGTSRGFGVGEFRKIGELVVETLDGLARHGESGNAAVEALVRDGVAELTRRFPIY